MKTSKKYKEFSFISKGAIGEVYRAKTSSGEWVAVKRLHPHLVYDKGMVERFLSEAKVLKVIDHPIFPKLIEAKSDGEEAYLVMKWMEGEPFQNFFRKNERKTEKGILIFALSLLQGLDYLQKLQPPWGGLPGLIHGDLTPKNVLVTPLGEAKILDFTHSVWMAEGGQSKGGSFGYMSLEQMRHNQANFQTDLYMAALLIHEALIGKPVLKRHDKFSTYVAAKKFDPVAASREATPDSFLQDLLIELYDAVKTGDRNPTAEIISAIKAKLAQE